MKASLQLRLGHQLSLTPQLQQAIRLLQLSTLDLQHEIQQQIECNPMLELSSEETAEDIEETEEKNTQAFDEGNDFQWATLYPQHSANENEADPFEAFYSVPMQLKDYLHWQLDLCLMSDLDRIIGETLIDATNDAGFLTLSMEELIGSLKGLSCDVEQAEIEAVKHRMQLFEPIGCVVHQLAETLSVQLGQLSDVNASLRALTQKMINQHIHLLGQHNYRELKKIYHISESQLSDVLELIKRLNPTPGISIENSTTEYIIPDLFAKKINSRWQACLNTHSLPRLKINNLYASLIKRVNNERDNQFLKHNLQEARWFLKSIESRQETLLRVAQYLVEYQQDFFEKGEEGMRALTMMDVASALGLHESTISRVTTQKYLHTPRGLIELKHFFSSHLPTEKGEACSSMAIRALIKKMIQQEDPHKPYSDQDLVKKMQSEHGIHIARRTIAKYREIMGILPSNERKIKV